MAFESGGRSGFRPRSDRRWPFLGALFDCQQAAEKSLKGFLTWHDKPFRKTHDLDTLGAACAAIDLTLTVLAAEVDVLSDYAWKLRYPGTPYRADPGEAAEMFGLAGRVFAEIQSRLPLGDASPDDRTIENPDAEP